MRCRYLGWAGLELEHDGARLVIDPLRDPTAVFAAAGPAAATAPMPELTPPAPGALAGLVTHLHRDHADARALQDALSPSAPVHLPAAGPLPPPGDAGVRLSRSELAAARLELRPLDPWETTEIGPFTVTALPAADGTGDPQLSWAVAAGDRRIVHAGDTMFHGWWWRAAAVAGPFDAAFLPVNGAVVAFPWRRPASPLPAVMSPDQAVQAAQALDAACVVPIHFGGFDLEPYYRSEPDAAERFTAGGRAAGLDVRRLGVGEALEV